MHLKLYINKLFNKLTLLSVLLVFSIVFLVALFLTISSIKSLSSNNVNYFLYPLWSPDNNPVKFGISSLMYGTIMTSVISTTVALIISIALSVLMNYYLPKYLSNIISTLIYVMSSIPSIIYGLLGLLFILKYSIQISSFLNKYFGFIPIFGTENHIFGRSLFTACIILIIMITPIITHFISESLFNIDNNLIEGAYSLGMYKEEVIRLILLPSVKLNIVTGTILGFTRAIGETVAVSLIVASNFSITKYILDAKSNTIAANIANNFKESLTIGKSALMSTGLVLFIMTMVLSIIVQRLLHNIDKY